MPKLTSLALFCAAASVAAQAPVSTPVQTRPVPTPAPTAFCDTLRAQVEASPAHWGLSVTTLDGTPLCQIHESQLFRPASTAKLFTTSAALELLGPGRTFETRVTGNLDPSTGTVTGDLTLVGGGDANLDSGDLPYMLGAQSHKPLTFPALDELAAQLAARGVRTISGDIVGDDTRFPHEPYAFGVEWNDLPLGFGAPVSALTIHDNALTLNFAPGHVTAPAVAAPAQLSLDQHGLPYYTLVNDVTTVPATSPEPRGFSVDRLPGSRTLRVYGVNGVDGKGGTGTLSIDDPALFAAMAFRQALLAQGITVAGTARAKHRNPKNAGDFLTQLREYGSLEEKIINGQNYALDCMSTPDDAPVLAAHTSAPLAQDIRFTLKESQNLHAELLLHHLGNRLPCEYGSILDGARAVRAWLLHIGIAADTDVTLYDGSGLSGHDLITPRALTQLLVYDARQPWFPTLKSALPIGGTDGTLASRFTGQDHPELKGKVLAKTGTLGETRTLAGFLTAASGQTLVFAILTDNHPPGSTADRSLADQFVAQIAAAN